MHGLRRWLVNWEQLAALTLDLPTYEASECPLCAAGEPIGAPGSSGR